MGGSQNNSITYPTKGLKLLLLLLASRFASIFHGGFTFATKIYYKIFPKLNTIDHRDPIPTTCFPKMMHFNFASLNVSLKSDIGFS